MSLTLHFHPLSSYCHKVLIALYESGLTFDTVLVDLSNEQSAAQFRALNPLGKMPVLCDASTDRVVAETSIILEYLRDAYPEAEFLIPHEPDRARETRFWDRFADLYLSTPLQKIVGDTLRPEGQRDPFGVENARMSLQRAYDYLETRLQPDRYIAGRDFDMADCSATPPLFYCRRILNFDDRERISKYYQKLVSRPSVRRVLTEAQPYWQYFPLRGGETSISELS